MDSKNYHYFKRELAKELEKKIVNRERISFLEIEMEKHKLKLTTK
jgi:hypothetical protein